MVYYTGKKWTTQQLVMDYDMHNSEQHQNYKLQKVSPLKVPLNYWPMTATQLIW